MKKLTSLLTSVALVVLPIFAALPVTDSFTGSDGTTLGVYNTCWQLPGADLDIQSNAAHPAAASTSSYAYWKTSCDTFNNDQYAEATFTALAASTYIGVMARASAGDNYYICYSDASDQLYLRNYVAGSLTTLGSTSPASVGQTIRIEAVGTSISCKINGSTVLSATDSSLTSGAPGLAGYNNGASAVDNFVGDNYSAPAASTARRRVVN